MKLSGHKTHAFTLVEMVIVAAIIGLIAAMGLPSLERVIRKEGMRKAVSDITDVLETARANAIFKGRIERVVFHPAQGTFAAEDGAAKGSGMVSASALPDGINIEALGINTLDFTESDPAPIDFYPDGTADEAVIVLHGRNEWSKITLDFATGLPSVGSVDK